MSVKYKLKATIGLPNYSNIQPEVELEGEDINELHASAMAHISEVWAKYGERPLKGLEANFGGNKELVELISFTGDTILYDESGHRYLDKEGNVFLSGSKYAESVSPKFNKGVILPKTAMAWGVNAEELDAVWGINGKVATEYGSSIHLALENWFKYGEMGAKIAEAKELPFNYVLPKNDHIRSVVELFVSTFGLNGALSELLITDTKAMRAGRIDLLEVLDKDKKVCRVGDYKTNKELDKKKILQYQHQMSFYAHILIASGWTVEGLDIYHYNGDVWEKISLDVLDLVS